MPSERAPFHVPRRTYFAPAETRLPESGLGWRRRVPPPGPKDLFRCPFIAIAAPCGRLLEYRSEGATREGEPLPGDVKVGGKEMLPAVGQTPHRTFVAADSIFSMGWNPVRRRPAACRIEIFLTFS